MKKEHNDKRIKNGMKHPNTSGKVTKKKRKLKTDMKKCAKALNDIMEEPDTPQHLPHPLKPEPHSKVPFMPQVEVVTH